MDRPEWATEQELIDAYGITAEHCGSCHSDADVNMWDMDLPDGRTAPACCEVRAAIKAKKKEVSDGA